MFDVHLSLELLEAVADGSLSRETFQQLALEHTLEKSPRVAALAAEVTAGAGTSAPSQPQDYEGILDRVQASAGSWLAVRRLDEKGANLDFAELSRLPSSQWATRIQSSRRRFRSPSVAERLLAVAKVALAESRPNEVLDAARAAFWVARRLAESHEAYESLQRELTLRASAYEAMASRALGDLAATRRLLDIVRQARSRGELGGDPLAEAEVAYFEGLVDRDDERFGDAEANLLLAITTTNALGAEAEEAEARLAFAQVLLRTHELPEAEETLLPLGTEELADISPETLFSARLILAEIQVRLERPRDASATLTATRELASALGPVAQGRLALCRGLVATARGWHPESVRDLERAFELLRTEAPLLAARAAVIQAALARAAGRDNELAAARERLRHLLHLPAVPAAALAEALGSDLPATAGRELLADLSAYLAAAHDSPGLPFHRGYPGAWSGSRPGAGPGAWRPA
ncbi:MAG: hypothetical protein SF066_00760 [Thermoanaerobaculia bacterium]|nr:hypothetical protein [Thermoanaerobaculia bacterium]